MKINSKLPILLFLLLFPACGAHDANPKITVASKKFTESVLLGEMAAALIEHAGAAVEYKEQLGGTRILWSALLAGDIDVYPDYTGTIMREILAGESIRDTAELRRTLRERGIGMSGYLGFNNTYALAMRGEQAEELGITTISDLRSHPELQYAFTNEFLDRGDGFTSMQTVYNLPAENVRGIDHDLAYRGLAEGSIDVMDAYSTDAEIAHYNLRLLKDDRKHFTEYQAVFLYRTALAKSAPRAIDALNKLAGRLREQQMRNLNGRVKLDKETENAVAASYLERQLQITAKVTADSFWQRLLRNLIDHLALVAVSLGAAILLAIPLGLAAYRWKRLESAILGAVGIIQTIPSLALLVFMIPLFGIGAEPAIAALLLYSLLPIVRNTFLGFHDIPAGIRESAEALGLSRAAVLKKIELPLAATSILAGIKTSAVINVGAATLGALIGAGGFGQPILTGIRLDSTALILEGAVPAALLALAVQYLFDLLELAVVPGGLRLKTT